MKVLRSHVLKALAGLILSVWVGAAVAQDALEDRLGDLLDDWREAREVTGVTMAVAAPGRDVMVFASGMAVVEDARPMTPDHHSLLASVTKTFVATAVLQLVDGGELTLDDRLRRWVPDAPNAAEITIRQLLSHTSGLPDYLTPEARISLATTAMERHATDGSGFMPQELLDIALAMPPAFEPGTSFAYSNTNTLLLGRIVEKVTDMPLHDALREQLFEPLGLESFHLAGAEPAPSEWGPGYATDFGALFGAEDGIAVLDQRMSMMVASSGWASGALVGSVGDVARFHQTLMGGEILEPTTLAEMVAPSPVVARFVESVGALDIGGGLGVFLYPFPDPIGVGVGHDGGEPGYRSLALSFPAHEISIAVLVNDGRPQFSIFPRGEDVDTLFAEAVFMTLNDMSGG